MPWMGTSSQGRPSRCSHLTIGDAARLAVAACVRDLYLTHVSSRYRAADIEAEARAAFPRARLARDFDHFRILR